LGAFSTENDEILNEDCLQLHAFNLYSYTVFNSAEYKLDYNSADTFNQQNLPTQQAMKIHSNSKPIQRILEKP
jgi:hypothetical protein